MVDIWHNQTSVKIHTVLQGVFLLAPLNCLSMELALPPYKNSAKFQTGPPQHQNYSMFRADSVPKQPRT